MMYISKIKYLNPDVEEEVILLINGMEFTCFIVACPWPIEVGKFYKVELSLFVLNDFKIVEVDSEVEQSIAKKGDGFAHILIGNLNGNALNVGGVTFEGDMLQSEFGYLDGKKISCEVDRINVEFIAKIEKLSGINHD